MTTNEAKRERGRPRSLVYGVGINDADYKVNPGQYDGTGSRCPYYERWRGMIERCYSEKWIAACPSYKGVTVCDDWLRFSNFRAWMVTQDWEGMQLDKDIMPVLRDPDATYIADAAVYSPENCCFVPQIVNTSVCVKAKAITNPERMSGIGRPGVRLKGGVWYSLCKDIDGKLETERANSEEEAAAQYRARKADYISAIALRHTTGDVRRALFVMACIIADNPDFYIDPTKED